MSAPKWDGLILARNGALDEENIFNFYNYLTNYNAPMFICKFFFFVFPSTIRT